MCTGVTRGLAGIKFSASIKEQPKVKDKKTRANKKMKKYKISLTEQAQWKGTLYVEDEMPNGLLEPSACKKKMCRITKAVTRNGRRQCSAKNRTKVGDPTANPPQTHCTKEGPKYGIADKRFVITVAAQQDI